MSDVRFSMAVCSQDDLEAAMNFMRPMMGEQSPMMISLSSIKKKGRPTGKASGGSLKERVEQSVRNAHDEISTSVLKSKLRCGQSELETALSELAHEGKILKSLGRFYAGSRTEKWRVAT